MTAHPFVGITSPDAREIVDWFVEGLQAGIDQRDAEVLNRQFAMDVMWGSPYGALINGYDQLHPIHVGFQQSSEPKPSVRYEVRHTLALSDDVIVAHVARLILSDKGEPLPPTTDTTQPFSEMAMFVLVRSDGQWWLAAGQNTPMRLGGAVPAST